MSCFIHGYNRPVNVQVQVSPTVYSDVFLLGFREKEYAVDTCHVLDLKTERQQPVSAVEKAFWKKSGLLYLLSSVFATFSCTVSVAVVLMHLALGGASAVQESCLNSTQRLSHRPKSLKKSFYTLVNVTWNVDLTKILSVKVLSKDPKYASLKQPPWEMCSSKFMLIQTRCLSMAIFIFSA